MNWTTEYRLGKGTASSGAACPDHISLRRSLWQTRFPKKAYNLGVLLSPLAVKQLFGFHLELSLILKTPRTRQINLHKPLQDGRPLQAEGKIRIRARGRARAKADMGASCHSRAPSQALISRASDSAGTLATTFASTATSPTASN